jgi:hypothetical protein
LLSQCQPKPAVKRFAANCVLISLLILHTVTARAHPKRQFLAAPLGTVNTTAAPTPTEVNEEQEPDKMTGTSTANKVVTPIVVPKGSSLASVDESSGKFPAESNNTFANAIPKVSAIRILPRSAYQLGQSGFKGGSMTAAEQALLARTYQTTNSVFEWGMGSSTVIAGQLGVPRLTAVDSVMRWVESSRTKVNKPWYCLTHSFIGGNLKAWGFPADRTSHELWPYYQVGAISSEMPFETYLVDGRFRGMCLHCPSAREY